MLTNDWIPDHHKDLNAKQFLFLAYEGLEALYGGAAGGGKLLYNGSMIPTPSGFRLLSELHPGDFIFGRDGLPHVILAESEEVVAPAWRLTFDDGAELIAHDDHRWLTFDAKELGQLTRLDPEWRKKRRARRASRSAIGFGQKWKHTQEHREFLSQAITERNRRMACAKVAAPQGTVRTTAEIASTLKTARGRLNHAIPVADTLDLPDKELPLDPYVLGVWLGDGTTSNGSITSMDSEIVQAVVSAGFPIRHVSGKSTNRASTYTHEGLRLVLKSMGLIGNKHIPHDYLWASPAQRLALLQGLLDTDGTATRSGSAEFTNTRLVLAEGVAHLARSLGHKATVRQGIARLNGRQIGPKWTVKFKAKIPVFRLRAKADRLELASRRTTRFRYITAAERVAPIPMKCLRVSSPDHLYLAGESLVPTHNSDALLIAGLQYMDSPGHASLLLRRTYSDLSLSGALMDRAASWLGNKSGARWREKDKCWQFPSGASMTFGYLETEKDKYRYASAEFQTIAFDEVTQFEESQYRFLFSRLRRTKGLEAPLRMRAASNPGGVGHSWCKERFLPEGFDRLSQGERFSKPWIKEDRLFFPASLRDNPALDAGEYTQSLNKLDPFTRAQLLEGDWSEYTGGLFRRDWFQIVDDTPAEMDRVRAWDLAATEVKPGTDPDWTVGVRMGKHRSGVYYVEDVIRTRASPRAVEALVRQTAELDGLAVRIVMEQEPGSSGVGLIDHYQRNVLTGYSFAGERPTGDKVSRAQAFSSAAEAGNVKLKREEWCRPFLEELELFGGGGNSHDDQADSASMAFNKLAIPRKYKRLGVREL